MAGRMERDAFLPRASSRCCLGISPLINGNTLGHGATLVRCVLFDGVDVPDGTELSNAIVTPGEVIPCRPTTLPPGPMGSP